MLAQHSSETNEHYTPAIVVKLARQTLERIDLDPASCALANEVVDADYWLGQLDQSLFRPWLSATNDPARVFLNPPGGRLDPETLQTFQVGRLKSNGKKCSAADGVSSAAAWWAKLWSEWHIGNVHSAIFVCFSMSIFRTAQEFASDVPAPFEFPFCVPSLRINYDRVTETGTRAQTSGAPADSAIVYLPPRSEDVATHDFVGWQGPGCTRFESNFSPLGRVRI